MEQRGELEELEKIEVGVDAQVQVRAYIMYRISLPHTDAARPVLPRRGMWTPFRHIYQGAGIMHIHTICSHPHSMWQVAAWRRPSFLVRTMRQWTASGRGSEALEVLRDYAR